MRLAISWLLFKAAIVISDDRAAKLWRREICSSMHFDPFNLFVIFWKKKKKNRSSQKQKATELISQFGAVWNHSLDQQCCQLLMSLVCFLADIRKSDWQKMIILKTTKQRPGREDYPDLLGTLPGQSSGWKLAPAWLQTNDRNPTLGFVTRGIYRKQLRGQKIF